MPVNAPLYTTEILRLASTLAGPVVLARTDGRSELRSPTCGSTIVVAVMADEDGCVAALSQEVRACAFGQASAALLEQGAIGRSADEVGQAVEQLADWLSGRRDDAGDWPGLDALAPARSKSGRHGAILLPFRALERAMRG
jgi:NifU-like protein involved in Fe-S cluster formation